MPRPLVFPKSRHLTSTSEFQRVRETGGVTRGELLTLGVLRSDGDEKVRAGFVTSRRVGGAIVRNRVRRRLREIVRRHQDKILRGTWIVTIARPQAARATYDALKHEWLRLAKRASILAP